MRALSLAIVGLSAMMAAQGPARADDAREVHAAVEMRVGETKTLGTFGAHKLDCLTSIRANRVEVSGPPKLGVITQRENAPYTARNSLSGTCEGSRFLGTAVDYTARSVGSETIVITVSFNNGQARRIVSITVDR